MYLSLYLTFAEVNDGVRLDQRAPRRCFGATTRDDHGFPIFGASFDYGHSLVVQRTRRGWACLIVQHDEDDFDDDARKQVRAAEPELYTWVHFREGDDVDSDYPPLGPNRWSPVHNTPIAFERVVPQ